MTHVLLEIHTSALAGMVNGPRQFARWAALAADEDHPDADLSEETFREHVAHGDEELKTLWKRHLTTWDFAESPTWSPDTAPHTDARRAAVYDRLRLGPDLRKALDCAAPVARVQSPTVITAEYIPWYTPERASARSFYWTAYERKLRAKGWPDEAVASLDEASRAVVERLCDPEQEAARQAKGLVVGYVQSGKTANFTGVTAKAIDAGYRLVIVLGGTLNLLRAQTQRRLDMELIGQENILRGADPADVDTLVGVDYVGDGDADWPHFVRHGARPSTLGAFDIERLTTRDKDYVPLAQGIRALAFDEKRDTNRPLYDPVNLHHAAARVLVVKKNKAVLTKLVKDLKQIHSILGEIPTLIIDDESDQASVNTSDPKKWQKDSTERTAINGLLSQLLGLLPRAQYVGYTATPFANVFVDPADAEDIFPSDFLISLPRPQGYMGVQDFHDLDSPVPFENRTHANSQEKAHVRGIYDPEDGSADDRLQEAMDAFVLSGALKLFRTAHGVPEAPFRHHTMLVHESVKQDDHAELALRLNTMWHEAGYTSPTGHTRLAHLWQTDFAPVSAARAPVLPSPTSYDDLRPYISRARQLIGSGGRPVVVVNGDSDRYFDQLDLDFDRTPNVWKILVGGTKLSRGFTVEGLTITYYRRTTQAADTLMQMGRWFGFRPNYRDLVRLYIGREETFGRSKSVDLYEAFEAVCQDEEDFRAELSRYSALVDGKPQVTPNQIPPLVSQHLPLMKPSARNKMFNAELLEIRSPGQPIEPRVYPRDAKAIERNARRWGGILDALAGPTTTCQLLPNPANGLARSFQASTTVVSHTELLGILGGLEWEDDGRFINPHLTYLAQLDGSLARVDDWLVIAPHLTEKHRFEAQLANHGVIPLSRRSRAAGKPFNRIASGDHRLYVQHLTDTATDFAADPAALAVGPHRGVVLLYPTIEAATHAEAQAVVANGKVHLSQVLMAFTITPPRAAIDSKRQLVRYRTRDSRRS